MKIKFVNIDFIWQLIYTVLELSVGVVNWYNFMIDRTFAYQVMPTVHLNEQNSTVNYLS